MIMKHLEAAVEHVRKLGYVPVYAALYGSQNYGLDIYGESYQSDYDVKVVVMPTLYDVVYEKCRVSTTIEYEGGQIDLKDALSMTEMFLKMNPSYLEILQTPFYLVFPGGEYMEELRSLLPTLLIERAPIFAKASYGHFQEKIKKMSHVTSSTAEKIKKYGYDGKHAHHAFRLKLMLEDFEKTGRVVLHPPTDSVAYLLRLKANDVPLEEVLPQVQLWHDQFVACAERIIASCEVIKDSADHALSKTRQALYLALKSPTEINSVMDAREVNANGK